MKLKAHTKAYFEEQLKASIYRVKIPKKKEVTNHYSLIPNNKENNMDLKIQGQTHGYFLVPLQ